MAKQKRSAAQVRIIGGKWKGRKLRFQGTADLRPTLARTRETLFNWIRADLDGARCLDAFAGSGALGFEALSQGALEVTFVEQHPRTARTLQDCVHELNAQDQAQVIKGDALVFLQRCQSRFDLVFLDPPYSAPELLERSLSVLSAQNLVEHLVYAEVPRRYDIQDLCTKTNWTLEKQTKAGDTLGVLLSPQR